VEKALAQATLEKPNVLLIDLAPPTDTAINCIRQLRARFPKTEALALIPSPEPQLVTRLVEAGAGGCLVKPVTAAELVEAIVDLHDYGAVVSGEVARVVIGALRKRGASRCCLGKLSGREHEILEQLSHGFQSKEIASHCAISVQTVNSHLARIYKKLNVHSRAAAVTKFLAP
jgi:DNA-binding NarL/FixJ family response regulator